jgi:hypothetical protein
MRITLLAMLLAFTHLAMAQGYELKDDEMKGHIITKKGVVLKGYIKLNGNDMSPWNNQTSVEFFTEDAMADGKVKGKEREKYKPKDIKGYVVGDRHFESMKISVAKLDLGMGIDTWKFVERIADGHISVYRLFETPEAVSVTTSEEQRVAQEQELERIRTEPRIVLIRDNDKPTLIQKVNFAEYLEKCPEVQEKYSSGGYGIEPWNPDAESKLGKWISNQANAEQIKAVIKEIITDYNACTDL